jgi:hypothetical protein
VKNGLKARSYRFLLGKEKRNIHSSDLQEDLNLSQSYVLKGKNEESQFGFRAGISKASFTKWAPAFEAFGSTPAASVESLDIKGSLALGFYRSPLDYLHSTGIASTYSLTTYANIRLPWTYYLAIFSLLVGGGVDYVDFSWNQVPRDLEETMSKIVLGFEVQKLSFGKLTYHLQFRREWPIAAEKDGDDTYIFGKSMFQIGIHF